MTYVALLRGLNVGAHNRLKMSDLVAVFTAAGCAEVSTYIQSGNVVFNANATLARKVPLLVERALKEDFDVRTPVVLRSAAELQSVLKKNPFLAKVTKPELLHVAFLAEEPTPAQVSQLDATRVAPDEFIVKGREVYLYTPNGLGKSKVTNAWLDSKLKTISTARNWRTVNELAVMSSR